MKKQRRGRPRWTAPRRVQSEWRREVWEYRIRVALNRPYPNTVDREELERRYGL